MSVKRVARIRRARHVIRFYSAKNASAMVLESFLELWMACKLESDPSVKTFASQPESMNKVLEGKNVRYTPDFLVIHHDGSAKYIEIHHEQFTSDEYRQKIATFDQYTRQSTGTPIELLVKDCLNEIELVNFQLLARHRTLEISVCESEVAFPEDTSVGQLIAFLTPLSNNPICDAYHLMASGFYQFDYNTIITTATRLSRGAELC